MGRSYLEKEMIGSGRQETVETIAYFIGLIFLVGGSIWVFADAYRIEQKERPDLGWVYKADNAWGELLGWLLIITFPYWVSDRRKLTKKFPFLGSSRFNAWLLIVLIPPVAYFNALLLLFNFEIAKQFMMIATTIGLVILGFLVLEWLTKRAKSED